MLPNKNNNIKKGLSVFESLHYSWHRSSSYSNKLMSQLIVNQVQLWFNAEKHYQLENCFKLKALMFTFLFSTSFINHNLMQIKFRLDICETKPHLFHITFLFGQLTKKSEIHCFTSTNIKKNNWTLLRIKNCS